ncbi:MAG: serine/threonine protein kinase [Planctomycetaceae bacterium]|jgi:serine/threonine-protein kinase|nr:serine/threonine protein kinase [Planctomycetaceae bacterium]
MDLTNRQFCDYHIIRKIGSGATADVYLAEQTSLGRRIALKILKPELANDDIYIKRFVREARAIAAVVHPNLVQIYQTDCLDGYWFIAQEYVQGQTLQHQVHHKGPLPYRRTADILWAVASALDKAAQAGIVHRDIKPENILLGDNGDIKVADFGLARFTAPEVSQNGNAGSLGLTQIGMTLGTPLYMSPEQAQGKPLDHRSDMYSLGVSAYHILAGQPPFRGETALAVALQHVNERPAPLSKHRPDIPPPLMRIVERMLEKAPNDRFETFHQLLLELRSFYSVYLNDDDAASRLADWNQLPLTSAERHLLAAAEKLQRVMKKERRKNRSWFSKTAVISLLFAAILGTSAGFFTVKAMLPPLRPPKASPVTKRATVAEQWVYACMLNNPDGWWSVIDYFPEESYFWGRKAKRQLIRYYFHNSDTVSPLPLFREFAEFSDIEAEDQPLGFAGLAWCAAENQDDKKEALHYLRQLYDTEFSLSDPLLLQILDAANAALQKQPPAGTAVKQ